MAGKHEDLPDQYDHRAQVPDHPAVMARWRTESDAARAAHPPQVLKYGPGERQRIDWFDAGPQAGPQNGGRAPVVVFIPGGDWLALDGGEFSFVASPLLAHGVSVVIPTHDPAPDARLGRVVDQTRAAVEMVRARTDARPVVVGHGAGGHLAACMLSEGRASAAVAISGLFDLEPLVATSLNAALGLNVMEARALSPIHWPPPDGSTPGGTVLDCIVGGAESEALIRQSRDMAELWGSKRVETRFEVLPGLNHFTVLDPLFDPDSALVRRLADLARGG